MDIYSMLKIHVLGVIIVELVENVSIDVQYF